MQKDQEIIDLLGSGEPKSLNKGLGMIYRYYGGVIRANLKSQGASREEQQDILQEVLVAVLDRFKEGSDGSISNLKYYLIGIARNKWFGLLRRKNRLPFDELGDLSIAERNDEVDSDMENIDLIGEVLDNMPGPCRDLLRSFYYEKKSNIEIAELMGYNNADTVKSKKYKCLQRLKDLVRDRLNAKG
jgi:RNA polymerase sigma factor (sigma-70 family)